MDLNGKCVLLGVSGGIAAYKMANVASALRKLGADVEVIMTKNATQFITPVTFETLTGHKCMVDTFDRDFKFEVTHISLAKKADVILVAPATANVIAKMAHGIADDMLTTTVLAAKCPKLVSPAMNTGMLENPITQDNIATLERYGFTVIPSESGVLACKDVGSGRLPKEDVLIEYILHAIARPKDLAGLRIAVTAGPTQEPLDPVRYLTNHSTGKMGYALARAAAMRGADVTLIHGETALQPVKFTTDVPVTTAQQMYEAVTSRFDATDVLIMAAAVADYRPAAVANDKIKKKDGDMSIPLERTPDILGTIGPKKTHQFLCGFSMETRDLVENSSAKLTKKNLDMVVANNLKVAGAGFGVDTNVVTLITPDGTRELPLMSKADVADAILDELPTEAEAVSSANKNYGEAQLVSVASDSGAKFFEQARLKRQKAHDEAMDTIQKTLKTSGLSAEEIDYLGKTGAGVAKASRRDLAVLVSKGMDGGEDVHDGFRGVKGSYRRALEGPEEVSGGEFLQREGHGRPLLGDQLEILGLRAAHRAEMLQLFFGQLRRLKKSSIRSDPAVCRDTVQIPVCQSSLCQRAECDDAFVSLVCCLLQTIFLNGTVKNGISVLVDNIRAMQLF